VNIFAKKGCSLPIAVEWTLHTNDRMSFSSFKLVGNIKPKVGIAYNFLEEGNYRIKVGNAHPTRVSCVYLCPST
jgi:hypothetical protein